MKFRKRVLMLVYSIGLICCTSMLAQDPPPPGIPAPQKEEVDHTAANEKLAKEIQKAIDALNELKDADKIEMLKKIKKHIEDNKKTEPGKNIDDAIKKAVKKGEGTPQWLEKLIREWKKTLGIAVENPDQGWKSQEQIQPIQQSWSYRPIYFTEGTRQINTSHALITYTFPPHALDVLLNVRIVLADGSKNWLLQNVPVPASTERISYRIRTDMQPFMQDDKWPEEIRLEYFIGPIRYNPDFPTQGQVALRAQPEVEDIGGSSIGMHPLFPVMYQPPSFTIPLDADTRQRIIRSMQLLDAYLRDSLNVSLPPFDSYRVDSLLRTSRPLDIVTFSSIVQGALPFNVSMDFMLVTLFPIDFIIRGDAVPNIDLDASKDPTDLNACVPAATANSLTWLDEQHEEIDLPGTTRETLDELKKLMKTLKEKGTEWDSMVKGKLDFIKKNNLPINVKYQAHAGAPAELKSNDPENTQTAKNKSEPNPEKPGKYYHPDFDWLMQELKDGEDVELIWGNYCDTVVKDTTWAEMEVPMGGKIKIIKEIKDKAKKTRRGGHAVNVTGAVSVGPFKWITYKHDAQQGKPGGTEGFDNNGDATDVSQWVTDERGYTNFANRNYKDPKDDVNCTVYVDAVISESYVPPPTEEKDTPTDDPPEDRSEDDSPEEEFADPWENVTLTGTEAKILPVVPVKPSIGVIPILAGVAGIGTVVYVVVKEDENATPCSFTAAANVTQPTCGLPNGSITITTEPAGMHTYQWAHGPDQQVISSLAPGNYTVTITQANTTCTQVLSSTLTDQSSFTVTASTQPSSCDQQDGSAVIQVTPSGAYTFVWSTGGTEQNQTQLAAGSYTVTVTNSASCTRVIDVVIDSTPFEPTITFTTTPSSCGQSDGTIQVTVDPSAAYDYNWSGGQTGAQIANVSAGTYTVTVSIPGSVCSKTGETTVDELPASFTLTTTTTPSTCGLSDGTASVTADPPGPYTIVWSDGQTTEQATGLLPGNYAVTVTLQGTTCSQSISVTVDESPATFTLTTTTTPAACGAADGTATVVVNPSGAYSYVWSSGHNTEQATALAAGTYTVTVSIPGTNCAQSISVTVDQLPPAFTLSFTSTPANCGQGDGTATVTPDPPGEYTFTWPGGQTTPTATGLMSGFHQVTVTIPGTTCSQTIDVEVGQVPLEITTTTSSTPAGCGIANGTATVDTVISPPGFTITFLWSDGQMGPMAIGLIPGNYTVTITLQAANCIAEFTDTVTVEQVQPNFTGTINTAPADCGIANGTATIVVVPDGAYTFLWSDQQTGPVLQNVMAGSYSVTVTDANSCTALFTTDIPQLPVEHITITGTTPGNCTGGGEISFTLVTNGAGPLVVEVISAEGTISFTIAPGNYLLSAFTTVFPGMYTLNVYDQGAGSSCLESAMTSVQDLTPLLVTEDDFYVTASETPVDGNMLDNDSGLDPEVTGISAVFGGTVTFTAQGDFTFIPDPDFTGDGMFTYTVTDACGSMDTGIVTITVESVECNFTIQTFITPANCGIANGAIQIEVMPAGNYAFFWNTGDTGSELTDIEAGSYTVTIVDVSLNCELVFDIEVSEYPAEYISDIVITQPTCTSPGEIQFTINSQGDVDFLNMSVMHPNGSDVFVVETGVLRLSDYVDITAGTYTIEVYIGNAGPECIEAFSADIDMVQSIMIFEEAVFPPSTPSAMDGGAIVIVSPPGQAPYQVFLNGLPYGSSPNETIQILGLGVGTYTVQVVDASGCESNELIIMIPFPDIILAFGMGIQNIPASTSNPEHTTVDEGWVNSTWMTVDYHLGNVPQRIRITYITPTYIHRYNTVSRIQGDYAIPITWRPGDRFAMLASAGIGMDNIQQQWNAHALLEGEVKWQVGKKMSAHGVVRTSLSDQSPQVTWSVNIALPF